MSVALLMFALLTSPTQEPSSSSSAAVSAAVSASASSAPSAVEGPSTVVQIAQDVQEVLPPPPADQEVPGLVEKAFDAASEHKWAGLIMPALLLLAWVLAKVLPKQKKSDVPPPEKK